MQTSASTPSGFASTSPSAPAKKRTWRDILEMAVKILVPLGITVWMLLWLTRHINLHEMDRIIRTECDFHWVALMMVIVVMSRITRGIRWEIQLRAAGLRRMPAMTEIVSIFGAYSLNLPHFQKEQICGQGRCSDCGDVALFRRDVQDEGNRPLLGLYHLHLGVLFP